MMTAIIMTVAVFSLVWGLLKFVFKITWGLIKFTGFLLTALAVPVFFIILFAIGISVLLIIPLIMMFAGVPMFRRALI